MASQSSDFPGYPDEAGNDEMSEYYDQLEYLYRHDWLHYTPRFKDEVLKEAQLLVEDMKEWLIENPPPKPRHCATCKCFDPA